MWDVVVVGARCAGAATALRFARAGYSALALDKSTLGSDTLSTHVLLPGAIAGLDALGIVGEVRATGAPPIKTFLTEFHGEAYAESKEALSVRRTSLDPILVRAAQDAGATVRHGVTVDGLLWERGRVVGVEGHDREGRAFKERARLVVGADGRHSLVARLVQAPEYNVQQCPSRIVYAYFRGLRPTVCGRDVFQFAAGPRAWVMSAPCDGGLHVVMLTVGRTELTHLAGPQLSLLEDRLRTIPTFAPRLAGAERVGKPHPCSPNELRGHFRQPYGPGWALVGDAGYCSHASSGRGIADALRSAELLYEGVERAWSSHRTAGSSLSRYQRIRDEENLTTFQVSYRLSKVNPFDDPEIALAFSGGPHTGRLASTGQRGRSMRRT